MSPRPILKRSGSGDHPNHHHHYHPHHSPHHAVHFPPSPGLTRTFSAYSASAYDRSPIVVTPNSCALPERGCPGRTYALEEPASPPPSPLPRRSGHYGGRDMHPRAFAFAKAGPSSYDDPSPTDADRTPTRTCPSLPPLVPDTSSESDESDTFLCAAPDAYTYEAYHVHGLAIPAPRQEKAVGFTPLDMYSSPPTPQSALSFLPYAPSSPGNGYAVHEDGEIHKVRKRRERRHESSRDPDRIRSGEAGGVDLSMSLSFSPPRRKSSSSKSRRSISICSALTSMNVSDDGCLGGF